MNQVKLAAKQRAQQKKKGGKETRIGRIYSSFQCECSKVKQATSRKKMISKLNISEIKPSSRRYPAIILTKSVKQEIKF
jgi:ATPase subunit of ABC transporter with duplicated ATPase domains